MGKALDLTGQVFGRLTVLKYVESQKTKAGKSVRIVECQCSCGNVVQRRAEYISSGKFKTCGCKEGAQTTALKLEGKKFGRVLVIARQGSTIKKKALWQCVCDCGKVFSTMGVSLVSGNTTSCGCYNEEKKVVHGHAKRELGPSHRSLAYSSYNSAKQRCYNPKAPYFELYGGRGITIAEEWLLPHGEGFKNFLEHMGRDRTAEESIDRINPDGNYEPGNVRWATAKEQANNKRNSKH